MNYKVKPITVAVGAVMTACLTATAFADTDEDLFALEAAGEGYDLLAGSHGEGECGEGKCGGGDDGGGDGDDGGDMGDDDDGGDMGDDDGDGDDMGDDGGGEEEEEAAAEEPAVEE